jgi:hypothetical protein
MLRKTTSQPSSQFVTKLNVLKNKDDAKRNQLQVNLAKDLSQFQNISRLFDELPRELMNEHVISQLETKYLDLFKSKKFPRTKVNLFLDQLVLHACLDLLGQNGQLDEVFVKNMNLDKVISKPSSKKQPSLRYYFSYFKSLIKDSHEIAITSDLCKQGVLCAYLGYVTGLLTQKMGVSEVNMLDQGVLKKFDDMPVPRSAVINAIASEIRADRIADIDKKVSIARYLKSYSKHSFASDTDSAHYRYHLSKYIKKELKSDSPIRQTQAFLFWIDMMYIAKEMGDYNTLLAIHSCLNAEKSHHENIPSEVLRAKFQLCRTLCDASNGYENIFAHAKERENAKLEVIPLYVHLLPGVKKLSENTENMNIRTSVAAIFAEENAYKKYIAQATVAVEKSVKEQQAILTHELLSLFNKQAKLIPPMTIPLVKSESAKLVYRLVSFFKTEPYNEARLAVEEVALGLQQNVSVANIYVLTSDALEKLKEIPVTELRVHQDLIESLKKIKTASTQLYHCGVNTPNLMQAHHKDEKMLAL